MKALLLCAGYGTRLYPLTMDKPKHLLEVGGKPILEHILCKIQDIEAIDSIYLITNAKFFFHFLEWAQEHAIKNPQAKRVIVINDGTQSNDSRLGALGDILFAVRKKAIKDDILLIAADNLFEFSLDEMRKSFEKTHKTTIALYDVKKIDLARHYGVVEADTEGKLTHFVEKPQHPKSTLISTGIYMIPKRDLTLLELYVKYGYSTDKIGSFFEWLHKKESVYCHVTHEPWYDIGTLEQLEEANRYFQKEEAL